MYKLLFQLSIYFFIIAIYSCYSKSAHPLFCIFIMLPNLQNCSYFIVLLYCSLNLMLSVSKRPFSALHASCYAWVRVSKSCRPFLPNQFFILGIFLLGIFYSFEIYSLPWYWSPSVLHICLWSSNQMSVVSWWVCLVWAQNSVPSD